MQSKAHREQKWKINTLPMKIGMSAIAETILQYNVLCESDENGIYSVQKRKSL